MYNVSNVSKATVTLQKFVKDFPIFSFIHFQY